MSFGVTAAGFFRKRLTDILGDLQAAIKDAFGTDKRVDAKSPIGIIVAIVAEVIGEMWEVLEAVYSSFDPSTAVGASMDNCLDLVGLRRLSNVYSTVDVALGGVVGTVIPVDSVVATVNAGDQFKTTTSTTLGTTACATAIVGFSEAVTSGHSYVLNINGYSYTHVATAGQDAVDVLSALIVLIEAGSDYLSGKLAPVGYGTDAVRILGLGGNLFSLSVSSTMQTNYVENIVTMQAVEEGAIPAYSTKLTEIQTPVTGWTYAVNASDADLGSSQELDSEARQRRAVSLAFPGATTPDALLAHLLNIPGVHNASLLQNLTDGTVGVLTPHSIMAVVLGGAESAIAEVMWKYGGCCEQLGSSSATVKDLQGQDQVVKWQRPTDLLMWVRMTYTVDPEADFPENGVVLMAAAALAVGYQHQPGQDVLPERFHGPVFAACAGIRTLLVEVKLDGGSYVSTPYPVAQTEVGRFDTTRIVVTL